MKHIILIRFGSVPNPAVTEALTPHINGPAIAVPVPGSILSAFQSESSIEKIKADLDNLGIQFFLFEKGDVVFKLPQPYQEAIDKVFGGETQSRPAPVREWTVDEVLDLINEHGIESLTPEQRAVLGQ